MTDSEVVRAAGVVVVRDGATGPEIAVIRRGLRADWSFAQHWHLGARLSNAFDEEYSLASGFATPGSELMVTLRWE